MIECLFNGFGTRRSVLGREEKEEAGIGGKNCTVGLGEFSRCLDSGGGDILP